MICTSVLKILLCLGMRHTCCHVVGHQAIVRSRNSFGILLYGHLQSYRNVAVQNNECWLF